MAHRSIQQPVEPTAAAADDLELDPMGTFRSLPPPLERLRAPRSIGSIVGGAAAVVVALGVGWWLLRPAGAAVESTLPMASSSTMLAGTGAPVGAAEAPATAVTTPGEPTELVVQAAGQVVKPGVYRLPPDARVDDLIREAGGFASDADPDRVNLAAPLTDGERIWIPAQGEDDAPEVIAGGSSGGAGPASGPAKSATPSPAAPVDLNAATAEDLDALPGVGPATAAAILSYRDQQGRFGSVDELLEVRGIGEAKLEQLRPLVRV